MKNDTVILIAFLALMVLYPVMCWAHRDAASALVATLFAPLVVVPVGALIYLVVGSVLNGFNVLLEYGDVALSNSTVSRVSWIVAGIAALLGLAHHIREQRHLSTIKVGPRWGGSKVGEPSVYRRRFVRK